MFQEANQYNTNMWNMANEYNLPKNQVQRLIEAGINPAAAIDAPQLGAASSPMSSASAPTMQGYTYQNPFANIGNDLVTFTQAMKNVQEAKNVDLQNKNYEWKLTEEIDLMRKQGMLSQQQADSLKQEYDLKEMNWDSLVKELQAKAYLTNRQAAIANLQHDLLMSYGAAKEEANLDKICAEAYNLMQDGKYKEAAKELTRANIGFQQAQLFIDRERMITERIVGNSTASKNYAEANLFGTQESGLSFDNMLNKMFGGPERLANLRKDIAEGRIKSVDAFLKELTKSAYTDGVGQAELAKLSKYVGEVISNFVPLLKSLK